VRGAQQFTGQRGELEHAGPVAGLIRFLRRSRREGLGFERAQRRSYAADAEPALHALGQAAEGAIGDLAVVGAGARPVRSPVRASSPPAAATVPPDVDRITGLLLGTAIGDSLGLPREGLSRGRAARIYGGPLRQRLVLGRGMLSDDTEHACMTAQALLVAGGDPRTFARVLAGKLRWWLLGLPAAVGWGTLRALALRGSDFRRRAAACGPPATAQ
jgi:hypothetical protein